MVKFERESVKPTPRMDSSERLRSRYNETSSSRDYADLLEQNEQLKAEMEEIKCNSTPDNELQQQILSLELKLTALQSEYDEAEKAGYALHDYIKKAQSAWTNANARAMSANQSRTEADAEVQSLRSALEKAERNASKIEKEHKSEATKLSYEIEDLKEKYSACRKELKLSRKECTKLVNSRSLALKNKAPSQKELYFSMAKIPESKNSAHVENPRGMIVNVDKQSQFSEDGHANHLEQLITIQKAEYKTLQDHYLELKTNYNNVHIENSILRKIAQDYELSRQALREFSQSIDMNIKKNEIKKIVVEKTLVQEENCVVQYFEEKSRVPSLQSLSLTTIILLILVLLIYSSKQICFDLSTVMKILNFN